VGEPPGPQLDEARDVVACSAIAAGRDPSAIGMEGRVTWRVTYDRSPTNSP
jgi:hypothetical protein